MIKQPKPSLPPYIVIRDTREKDGQGWTFDKSKGCGGTVRRKLDTGDYTLEGYETIFTIDRKGSISEFAKNLLEARFERELDRMSAFRLAVILLEFPFEHLMTWPLHSGIPKSRQRYMRITRHTLLARFWKLQATYPHVHFLFAGPYGKEAASSLFKRATELYEPRPTHAA